ncbi:MAG TPA: terminase family protein [Candidatus Binataceae bacterium]|nr:terminase family protein [Candidatus Binataceae bacterium]
MPDRLSILLPYQRRWIADGAQVKVAEKSRRIGATWTEAADCALRAAVAGRGGSDAWYIGYNKDMALEFVETAAMWARRFNKAARAIEEIAVADEDRDILAYRIRFASGRKIVALSSRPSNLRGKDGCAVIDEAAFHDDLPGLLKAALAFTMWGGRVRIISTHNGADNPFNELINDIRAGRLPYSLHRVTLDDAIRDGLYGKICERLKREWSAEGERAWRRELLDFYGDNADEELFCIPRASSGTFLSSMLIESRMRAGIPVLRWSMPSDFSNQPEEHRKSACAAWCDDNLAEPLAAIDPAAATCFGEDFGRLGDLTVIWPLVIGEGLVRRTPLAIELRNIPFRQQEQVLFYVADRLPRLVAGAMDARGNGQYLAEAARQRYGGRIIQVMLTAEWYRDNMPRYKAAFEDAMIELPRDADILGDHRAIAIEQGVARVSDRRTRGADHGQRHGDSAIAAALAYFASRAETNEIAYTPAPAANRSAETPATGLYGPPADDDSPIGIRAGRGFGGGAW